MLNLIRTNSGDPAFIDLVNRLDADLAERDGSQHDFYAQYNTIGNIKYAIVAYENDIPVGCGAIKEFDSDTMEIKRMYVVPEHRGKGFAVQILSTLEKWASELSYSACVLETGQKQPEAMRLYKKSGYHVIPNYGQYIGIENSICFEKKIR